MNRRHPVRVQHHAWRRRLWVEIGGQLQATTAFTPGTLYADNYAGLRAAVDLVAKMQIPVPDENRIPVWLMSLGKPG